MMRYLSLCVWIFAQELKTHDVGRVVEYPDEVDDLQLREDNSYGTEVKEPHSKET